MYPDVYYRFLLPVPWRGLTTITPRAGMVVVAVVNGEFTCKQLAYEYGTPVLRAANKAYPDIRLRDGEDLEVFGVVTRCIHKLPGC
ncbi:S24 family peptidase [Pseudomonas stutzeri]|uniref:LexA family protein n=1 Tax=Pseudomonadaceae TaxID=135621 RepID=UPI00210ED524|nr:S24 family peptidase [Stutzerimonas stutzeri]